MAGAFAIGASCFLIAPLPGFAELVGDRADAITFFAGSIFFTTGGALQSAIAWPGRRGGPSGRAAWLAAIVQSAGTLFFNRSTFRALETAVGAAEYNRLVWRPDALGSICFLVSGAIAYAASGRHGWRPARGGAGWWQPAVNLLGCVFFGVAAVAGHVVPATGSVLSLAACNVNTSLGAACFLACALATLRALRGAPFEPDADVARAGERAASPR
ncbi:MAG TPA: hypothetical protein VNV44_11080 [Solirubrobacteraceae bacterium]|jgi:hypothetical protein|nr:hypothetical protein [Solirubrobacteraceae bacterium]